MTFELILFFQNAQRNTVHNSETSGATTNSYLMINRLVHNVYCEKFNISNRLFDQQSETQRPLLRHHT